MHTSTGLLRPNAVCSRSNSGRHPSKIYPQIPSGPLEKMHEKAALTHFVPDVAQAQFMPGLATVKVVFEQFWVSHSGVPRLERVSGTSLTSTLPDPSAAGLRFAIFAGTASTMRFQDKAFPDLAGATELCPIKSLSRRERFFASDR